MLDLAADYAVHVWSGWSASKLVYNFIHVFMVVKGWARTIGKSTVLWPCHCFVHTGSLATAYVYTCFMQVGCTHAKRLMFLLAGSLPLNTIDVPNLPNEELRKGEAWLKHYLLLKAIQSSKCIIATTLLGTCTYSGVHVMYVIIDRHGLNIILSWVCFYRVCVKTN